MVASAVHLDLDRFPGRPPRILVVDDEAHLRETLGGLLELDGHDVVEAGSAPEGLRLARESRFDLVLSDIDMAGMDGVELWRRLQADPVTTGVPVIFLTGGSDDHSMVKLLDGGAVDYITKPFNPSELRARVRAAMRVRLLKGELEERVVEADAANRAKSEFLANMSHEIRTPLTAVLGYADLLLDLELSPSDRINYVQTIRRNGEHLLTVLNDLLDLSKIEAGKMTIEAAPVSPVQVAVDVASLMRVRALGKELDFALRFATPVPEHIRCDGTRLRQILMNLVGNAIKFTPRGAVALEVSCVEPGGTQPHLVFTVVDEGIGMTEEQLGRLFVPFAQADGSTTRRFGGTGLGLVICKRLADMLGGTIDVDSEPGRGSRFTLSIALERLDGVALLDGMQEACTTMGAGDGARVATGRATLSGSVLLAEDGLDNQLLVSTLLRRAGARVTIVENGRLAVERALAEEAAGQPFGVVLMDMQMPELDGYGATATLRARGYRRPIVALTAHAMASDRDRCLAAGCTDYLTKPIQRERLIQSVGSYLAAARTEREAAGEPPPATAPIEIPLVSELADDEDMAPLVAQFVASLPERAAALLEATFAGDLTRLTRLAHQLKGAAGGFGFPTVTTAAAALEQAAGGVGPAGGIGAALEVLLRLLKSAKGGGI
jgi:signal transduction histidine kinase/HPt (histidine-containing phosphotransfer) domain-containing protein